jgi:hypothetical protein
VVDNEPNSPKRRLNGLDRVLRRARIFSRLREGWAYDEIARLEQLTTERIRQIVREALDRRLIEEDADHAKLQLARLEPAMRMATEALEDGDVRVIVPFLKLLDRVDRYQKTAKVTQVYDAEARRKLFEKLNRVAANLGLEPMKEPAKAEAKEAAEGEAAAKATGAGGADQSPESGERRAGTEKTPGGGRRKSMKRLNPDKRIQGNRGFFLGFSLARLG